jgi:carbon-monoxide dehydrogenase medium subunit
MRLRKATGERWVAAKEFYLGILTTATEPDEILDEIVVPPLAPNSGSCFLEFARRKGDYALVGVAVILTRGGNGVFHDARIVYLNAGEIPVVATEAANMLLGESPSTSLFEAAADHAIEHEISPIANIHASAEYLSHLARVLTIRALSKANDRI